MLRSSQRRSDIRLPEKYAREYAELFETGVPLDLSLPNLLAAGLRSVLGTGNPVIVAERSPWEELSRLRSELAKLERDIERMERARDEQLEILKRCQADKTLVDEALLVLERRLFELQGQLGVDIIAENKDRRSS